MEDKDEDKEEDKEREVARSTSGKDTQRDKEKVGDEKRAGDSRKDMGIARQSLREREKKT